MLPFPMLAPNSTQISKPVPVSDLCVLCASAFSSPNLSPLNSNPSTRNLAPFVDALDAASSISPVFATLTKNTRGGGHILQTKIPPSSQPPIVNHQPPHWFSLFHQSQVTNHQSRITKSFIIRTSAKCSRNSFTMNTSKTQDLKLFRINTYEKTGGGVPRKKTPTLHQPPLSFPAAFLLVRKPDDHNPSAVANHFGQHAKPLSLAANPTGSYTGGPAKCRVWRSGSEVPCNGVARQPFSWPCKSVLNALQRPNCDWLIAFAAVATSKESSACRKPQYRKR